MTTSLAAPAPAGTARFTDRLADLLTGRPIARGRLVLPGRPPIEVRDGRYTVGESDGLLVGETLSGVVVEAEGCVPRRTSVVVRPGGLRVDLGYRLARLDLVSDQGLYERWLRARRGRTLERWDPALYQGAVVYDRQLFRHDGRKPVLYATDYDAQPSFVQSALSVAATEVAAMTGGALLDGVRLASRIPRSEWPSPAEPCGFLLFFTLLGYFDRHAASMLGLPFADGSGTIHGATLAVPPGRSTSPGELRSWTREAMGVHRIGSLPSPPERTAQAFGVLQYSRKVGHRAADLPDVQD